MISKMLEKLGMTVNIVLGLLLIAAAMFGAFKVFATNERLEGVRLEVQLVSEKLNKKVLFDDLKEYQKLVFMYDEKYGGGCAQCPPETKETYRLLKQKIRAIESQLGLKKEEG